MTQIDLERTQQHGAELNLHENQRSIAAANQNSAVARIGNMVYFLFGALEMLLAVRVILHLVGANADNGFANFINGLSAPFLVVFSSLLKNPVLSTTAVLEVTTIIAMIVYAMLAWLLSRLIWLALSRPR